MPFQKPQKGRGYPAHRIESPSGVENIKHMFRFYGMPIAMVDFSSETAAVKAVLFDGDIQRGKWRGLDGWREWEMFPLQRDAAIRFERQHRHGPLYYDRGVLIDSEIHPMVNE